jgi:hypothetical protein
VITVVARGGDEDVADLRRALQQKLVVASAASGSGSTCHDHVSPSRPHGHCARTSMCNDEHDPPAGCSSL